MQCGYEVQKLAIMTSSSEYQTGFIKGLPSDLVSVNTEELVFWCVCATAYE